MTHNQPITIEPVANGWIVRPVSEEGMLINIACIEVFQEMEGRNGLQEFIASHFAPLPPPPKPPTKRK